MELNSGYWLLLMVNEGSVVASLPNHEVDLKSRISSFRQDGSMLGGFRDGMRVFIFIRANFLMLTPPKSVFSGPGSKCQKLVRRYVKIKMAQSFFLTFNFHSSLHQRTKKETMANKQTNPSEQTKSQVL